MYYDLYWEFYKQTVREETFVAGEKATLPHLCVLRIEYHMIHSISHLQMDRWAFPNNL